MRIMLTLCGSLLTTLCSFAPSFAQSPFEESLFLRRIVDFWEEGEYTIAKHQMGEFLETYADSSHANILRMTLGDLFLREKNYQEAINCYAQISDDALKGEVFIRRMQCLYHLGWHATLADECEAYLQTNEDNSSQRLEVTYLLATALYEQCNQPSISEADSGALALRAKPYFEILADSPLSHDVAGALAHLRCLVQDFEGASSVYLKLASQSSAPDDYLFQAALLQSKYDKILSLQTFGELAKQEGKFAGEAAYNQLILCFDLGRHEEILAEQETFLQTVPPEKQPLVHLMLGQSLMALQKCDEAAEEFDAFLQADIPTEAIQPALAQIIEAAYRATNLALLDLSIKKWAQLDPEDPNLAVASFSRAQILKQEGKLEEAKEEISSLLVRFPHFKNRPEAAFHLIQLESEGARFGEYREAALFFLQHYPTHELAPAAWHHLLFASTKLAEESKDLTEQLIRDLESFLTKARFLTPAETSDGNFRLAKAYFDLGASQEARNLLEPICEEESIEFSTRGDAELLFALCLQGSDENLFCHWAEKALAHKATLLPEADQHLALFNAYVSLRPEDTDFLAKHLLASFALEANISLPNLLWLANYAFERAEMKEQAAAIAKHILERSDLDPKHIEESTLFLEPLLLKYAKNLEQKTESIALLQSLEAQYAAAPELGWHHMTETRFTLAEWLLAGGAYKEAESRFDAIASSVILRDKFAATAALQSARIKQTSPENNPEQILSMLKNISLQKTLNNEPVHLEAAIDYLELMAQMQPPEKREEKKLDLLRKMKANFEAQDDLLSKDYHASRSQNTLQNQIYLDYMLYLDAKILLTQAQLEQNEEEQKELQAKAKILLLQISDNTSAELQRRLLKDRG